MKRFHPREKAEMVQRLIRNARHSMTGWARANCPFCPTLLGKIDHKAALAINMANGAFVCFRCGTTGRMKEGDFTPEQTTFSLEDIEAAMRPPDGFMPLFREPGLSSLAAQEGRDYLRSRGLPDEVCAKAGIGACVSGKYEGRVIVPIFSPDAAWLGWVGRVWFKQADRAYVYPRGMKRAELLYNHAALLEESDTPVLVVEGVFDALAHWPNAVAVLGKPSEQQIYALASARRPVVAVLDGDAWREGWALAARLRIEGQRSGSVRLPPRLDPDEVPVQWLWENARRSLDQL